jgi:hypothetical protein
MATFRMVVEVDVSDNRAASETVANVVTKALGEALPALPTRVSGCHEVTGRESTSQALDARGGRR